MEVLRAANNFFESTKPWELRKNNANEQLDTVLSVTLETLRVCAIALQPIVPVLSTQILDKLCVPHDRRMWKDLDYVAWRPAANGMHAERLLCAKSDAIIFKRIRLDDVGGKESNAANANKKKQQKSKTIKK